MTTYKLPVTWQVVANVKVKADSLEEAISKLETERNSADKLPKGEYVNHSLEVQREFIEETEDNYYEIVFYGEGHEEDFTFYIKSEDELSKTEVKEKLENEFLCIDGLKQHHIDNIVSIREITSLEFEEGCGISVDKQDNIELKVYSHWDCHILYDVYIDDVFKGQAEVQFDDKEFNGHIAYTNIKSEDENGEFDWKPLQDKKLFEFIKKQAIEEYKK